MPFLKICSLVIRIHDLLESVASHEDEIHF